MGVGEGNNITLSWGIIYLGGEEKGGGLLIDSSMGPLIKDTPIIVCISWMKELLCGI